MADLPIAPGQVYIEVEYDYEYTIKDRTISIHQGECYMLVKKANEDWWQVRKEEGSKAFYVPAQYVREVRKALMPPPKPLPHPPAASGNMPPHNTASVKGKPTSLDLGLQNPPAENLHRRESDYRRSPSAQTAAPDHFSAPVQRRESNHHRPPSSPTDHDRALADVLVHGGGPRPDSRGKSSTLPRARARSPELVRAPLDVDSTQYCDSAGEDRRTNDSESGDELSSSSTEQLQVPFPLSCPETWSETEAKALVSPPGGRLQYCRKALLHYSSFGCRLFQQSGLTVLFPWQCISLILVPGLIAGANADVWCCWLYFCSHVSQLNPFICSHVSSRSCFSDLIS